MLFFEFDFTVLYKPRNTVRAAHAFSRIAYNKPLTGVDDSTLDATLFYVEIHWLRNVQPYLETGTMPPTLSTSDHWTLVEKALPFTLIDGHLHRWGFDVIERRVFQPCEVDSILNAMHLGVTGGHISQILQLARSSTPATGCRPYTRMCTSNADYATPANVRAT